ncbi:MAG: toprim domain-containing protein [Alphaproteobacteria bacterium]
MTQQLEFSRFKSEINLTQYAAHLGYEIDRKKSTRSSVAMKGGADKIIISRRGGVWVYFSVTDDRDNGTIINFVQNRTNKTIGEIGQELQGWIGGTIDLPEPKIYAQEVEEQDYDPARVAKVFKKCHPVKYHAYLESRGLTGAVLSSPRFTGRIYTDRYQNAAFPHYGSNGICGLELKNAQKAVFVRGSEKTLWRSNIRAGDTCLILAEAVIDALSYYTLFPDEHSIYGATGGGLSPEQMTLIGKFLEQFLEIRRVLIITDNDKGGDRLAEKIQKATEDSNFSGVIIRHSPDKRGHDWNDVLMYQCCSS